MTSAPRREHVVEATLNYLAPMPERPAYYLYEPPAGTPWRNTKGDRRQLPIRDARELAPAPSLDVEGFALVPFTTGVDDFADAHAIRERYYREVERLVARVTGAARVVAFDHNLRSATVAGRNADGLQGPVRYAHNDYTERSAPQRVRDLLGTDAPALLRGRFAVVNVWKPLWRPVEGAPLAVCDARTIAPGDLLETDLRYRDRAGEVYSLRFNPAHRWFYFARMRPDEAMLLKCYDSDAAHARFTAHSAFDDPTAPADAPPRESVEVRTLAFFAP
jgi:hypothetical protein